MGAGRGKSSLDLVFPWVLKRGRARCYPSGSVCFVRGSQAPTSSSSGIRGDSDADPERGPAVWELGQLFLGLCMAPGFRGKELPILVSAVCGLGHKASGWGEWVLQLFPLSDVGDSCTHSGPPSVQQLAPGLGWGSANWWGSWGRGRLHGQGMCLLAPVLGGNGVRHPLDSSHPTSRPLPSPTSPSQPSRQFFLSVTFLGPCCLNVSLHSVKPSIAGATHR